MRWSSGKSLEERLAATEEPGEPVPLIWFVRAHWPIPVRVQLAALWVARHVLRLTLR